MGIAAYVEVVLPKPLAIYGPDMICVVVLDKKAQLLAVEGFVFNAERDHEMNAAVDRYMEG